MSALILSFRNAVPRIAADVFIAPNATIIGDVIIGAGSSVWFGAVLEGCTIGAASIVGMNAVVLPEACIGKHSVVGAEAVVGRAARFDEGSLIVGSPAVARCQVSPVMGQFAAREYREIAQAYRAELADGSPPGQAPAVQHTRE